MSFILDALKKSEIERQRQAVPGLMDAGMAQSRARLPLWAIALVVLLGINLVVLLFVLTRGGTPAATDTRAVGSPKSAQQPAGGSPAAGERTTLAQMSGAPTAATEPFSPLDAAPVYAPEIPAAGGNTVAPGRLNHLSPLGGGSANIHATHPRDPLLTDDDYKSNEEALPSISEINLSGQQSLPDLHLDVHVFATNPAERFVYINMRKYHEGSTLEEGPILERIRRDGVVLSFHGLRFLLPRQQ